MMKTDVPARSRVFKHHADWLVVEWVTTSKSQLLIVFVFALAFWSMLGDAEMSRNSMASDSLT